MSISKFDFDKWWNSAHKGSSPEDMNARLEAQKAWLAVSELYEAEHNSEYKQCETCSEVLDLDNVKCRNCNNYSNWK